MALNGIRCSKCVGDCVELVKYGNTKSGNQRYRCKICNKTRVRNYIYNACKSNTDSKIILLTKEGLGIRSTARVLQISPTTLLKRIILIAKNIHHPIIPKKKNMKWMKCVPISGTNEILSGWFMHLRKNRKK